MTEERSWPIWLPSNNGWLMTCFNVPLPILITSSQILLTHLCASSTVMADLTSQILDALHQSDGPILTADAFPSIPSTTVKSTLDRLGSREMVVYRKIDREEALLTPEAEGIAANGSHEAKVFEAVRKTVEGLKIADLPVRGENCTPARLGSVSSTKLT